LSEFIPPFPPRPSSSLTQWQRLKLARRNLLSFWEEDAYEYEFAATKLLARNVFILNSPEAVQFAFSTHNATYERKSAQQRHALAPLLGDGLFVSDGDTWRRRRKIVAPIVHISRLGEFAPVMVEAACETRDRWAHLEPGAEIDALAEMAHLTAEIICRTVFGRQLGHDHARQIVEAFSDYQRRIDQIDLMSLIGLPDWLPRWRSPSVRRAVRRMHAVLDDIIASHRARGGDDVSVIGRLLDARDEDTGAPLDAVALRNEAAVLFMAGHETTANTLAWTWYLLSQTPEVEARLHAELDTVLGGRPPTLADVPQLVYTRAILEETLRLYPPVPLLLREATQDETFQEHRIPKGSLMILSPWLLHRHKKLWTQPDHFIPERFLPGGERPASKFAYVPFSIGPRICAGLAFGLTESILSMATLAQSASLRLKPGETVEPECRLTLRPGKTLPMQVLRRSGPRTGATTPPAPAAACPFAHA
jgi:cytochrome P450